jgi:UDP-N-acetylglucosamine 4,6-dehydratase
MPVPPSYDTILITGATGSWGNAAVRFLLDHTSATIRCFSRDWVKQEEMKERFQNHERLRFLLGDVYDFRRLQVAMDGVDLVFHAAALKQVAAGEYNITEVTKTNIMGTENVVRAARDMHVGQVVFLSSDKACLPYNSYGISKAYSERTVIQANGYSPYRTSYCCVRYGNVHGSRGSVAEVWNDALCHKRPLKVTDLQMSRSSSPWRKRSVVPGMPLLWLHAGASWCRIFLPIP